MPVRAHERRGQREARLPSGHGEELFEVGGAYYVGPGHTAVPYGRTEVVEFSRTEEFGRTMEVVAQNMRETEAASS